jgi:hypothetical protein
MLEMKKGAFMKNTITRVLAIALLTTSISAFAAPGKAKTAKEADPNKTNSDTTVVIYVVDEPSTDQDEAQSDQSEKKSQTEQQRQQKIQQQEQQWLHDLQNPSAG